MSAVQAAAGFGLSFLSLYLAWRIYSAQPNRSPKRPASHRTETETSNAS